LKLAAIDIGSNSMKVVVVEAASSASFDVLASDRETVRLGQETIVNKHISSAAMQRAVECLKRFRALADMHGAEQVVVTATAFLRAADNAGEFIHVIEQETGFEVQVLSGTEEARLIGWAAAYGCTERGVTSLNIDIGGGSTEISLFDNDQALLLHSIPIGAVVLSDRFIRSDPPTSNELSQLRTMIRFSLESSALEILRRHTWRSTTATSGTATTLGAALNHVWPPATTTITLAQLKQFNERLAALTVAERRTITGIAPERADIIVAGAIVLEELMSVLGIESVQTCDWSLREGVIIDQLSKRNAR
jgi:exopolyphosphatase/guanosine-5'-triphosphate,3'-diphosphate pyrophosphatase